MDRADYLASKREELVGLANSMLSGGINLIEGVRKVCALSVAIGDSENDVFAPMAAIESETDHYPLGEVRARCAEDYLRRMDAELESYLMEAGPDIMDACRDVIRTYSC